MAHPLFQNPQLDGSTFHLQKPDYSAHTDTGIILFHGFTATTVEMRPLAEYLHADGYDVRSPLLPGHGTKPEDMLSIRYEDWLDTADAVFQQAQIEFAKIVVGGESMGALLALHLAARYKNIHGLVVFAPAIHIAGQWRAPLLAPFIKFRPKYYLPKKERTVEPGVLPWQGYNVLPIPAAGQFYEMQKLVRRELGNITQPVLIFQGKLDETIDPQGAETILNSLGSQDKQLVWLDHSGHTLVLGPEHDTVFQITLRFIQRVTN